MGGGGWFLVNRFQTFFWNRARTRFFIEDDFFLLWKKHSSTPYGGT